VPPAENGRSSNATDTTVLVPKAYMPRGVFFNKLRCSPKFGHLRSTLPAGLRVPSLVSLLGGYG